MLGLEEHNFASISAWILRIDLPSVSAHLLETTAIFLDSSGTEGGEKPQPSRVRAFEVRLPKILFTLSK